MNTASNRRYTRIQFDRKVNLIFQGYDYGAAQIKDLSLSGMYVYGYYNQLEGDECTVILTQTGISSVLALDATAKVAWTEDEGIAIQFTAMTFDSYMFLQTSLLYEAENPLIIGMELPDNCPFTIIDANIEKQYQNTSHKQDRLNI